MAADTQVRMQFSLQDAAGLRATLEVPIFADGTQTLADATSAWTAQLALLEAITGGKVVGGGVTVVQAASATGGRPSSDARVQEVGVFDEGVAEDASVFGIAVPTLADAVLTADKTRIDTANAAVIAWRASLLAAVMGGNFTNRQYQTLTHHTGTLRAFRKYRKRAAAIGRTTG